MGHDDRPSVVLVVDDDAFVLMTAAFNLRAAGFTVLEASNANEALALLQTQESIGAVFTDVQMPGTMDGLGLARVVHRRWPFIKMVITAIGPQRPDARRPVLAEALSDRGCRGRSASELSRLRPPTRRAAGT
jgi:CheY-like chemotaxis protein